MKYFVEATANSTRTTTPAFKKNLNDDNASIKTAGGGYRRRQVSSLSSAKVTSARNRSNSNINIRLSSLADTSQTRLDDARERLMESLLLYCFKFLPHKLNQSGGDDQK